MKRILLIIILAIVLAVILAAVGCDKERIVESTEYIKETEYVELPPDTVFVTDTVTVNGSDTVFVTDTVTQTVTVTVHDTVTVVQHHYDTTVITDTVVTVQCEPDEYTALAALQYHTDPLVIEFINQEFGYTDGWVLYLSAFQLDLTQQSSTVYDMYGYLDYWTPDWSGYYPMEFYWRLTYTGGDPSDPDNWQMSEPPSSVASHAPGIRITSDTARLQRSIR